MACSLGTRVAPEGAPVLEKRPKADILLLLATFGVVVCVFLTCYCGMGIGVRWAIMSNRHSALSTLFLGLSFASLVWAHVTDLLWDQTFRRSRRGTCFFFVAGCLAVTGIMLGIDSYPYGPLSLFAFFVPVVGLCVDSTKKRKFQDFTAPLATWAVATGVSWIVWASYHGWRKTRKAYGERLSENGFNCRRTYEKSWMNDEDVEDLDPYSQCQLVFFLWVNPWCAAMILGICGGISFYVPYGNGERHKCFAVFCFVLVTGAWCAASLAGAGDGIASAIFVVCFSMALGSAVVFASYYAAIRNDGDKSSLALYQRIVSTYVEPYANAWRGLFVLVFMPIVVFVYIPIEAARQLVRQRGARGADWLTTQARRRLDAVRQWNWTKVLDWTCIFGFANIAVVVFVAKFTVLLMSVVVTNCESFSIEAATGIIIVVGLTLFLLPPVPGAPIYLAGGVLLTVVGRANGWRVSYAISYAAIVGLFTKLVACTCQQKLIGVPLKRSLWVRKTVCVNSPLIRTTRLVLEEPGFTVAKVTLLVGGPDWPTSVLCGILDLRIFPVLAGTTPIWFLIWPTVLGGAFLVIDEPSAHVLSTIFVGIAALVQSGALVVAAVCLNKEMTKRRRELEAMPFDQEVLDDSKRDMAAREVYDAETCWSKVPLFQRALLVVASTCLTIACYVTTIYPSSCFREFAVDDTISKHLKGRWTRLVKPLGVACIALFLIATVLYVAFKRWAALRVTCELVDAILKESVSPSMEDNPVT